MDVFIPKELHKRLHGKGQTGWGSGGPLNYQWRAFLRGVYKDKAIDVKNPRQSIIDFMEELNVLTATDLPEKWPIPKGLLP